MSTNSDPAEPVSILARISAKRNQEPTNEQLYPPLTLALLTRYQFTRPPTGSPQGRHCTGCTYDQTEQVRLSSICE